MAEEHKDKNNVESYDPGSHDVNFEEEIKNQDAATEVLEETKGLDANRYATKKTVAQGMLDIALLTSNASQLKYVLQVGPRHEFYMLLLVLISVSIVLQLLVGLLFVVIGGLDLNDDTDQPSAIVLNDVIVIFIFVISVTNIVISAFGIEYSNNPLVLERLQHINYEYLRKLNASAGILAIIISNMDGDHNLKQKKIADVLYHISVAMMTGVVFCDVIKMTFGLDPALSEQDHFSNKTHSIYDAFLNIRN